MDGTLEMELSMIKALLEGLVFLMFAGSVLILLVLLGSQ